MGRRSRITGTHRDSPGLTGTHRDSPGLTGTHRDSPVAVSPWAQRETGSAATEPRHGGAARRSLRSRHGSRRRTLRNKRDWEVRGVHLRTKGSWRRSTGIRSRAAGSQVRNDRRLRCPWCLQSGIGCVDDPSGQPFNGVSVVRRSALGEAKPVSALIPGVALTGSSTPWFLGLDRVSTLRSSLHSGAARAHLRSRCEPQVRGIADVASVTSSCSTGVRWTDADLRHLSRCQPQYHSLRPQPCPRIRVARTAWSSRRVIGVAITL